MDCASMSPPVSPTVVDKIFMTQKSAVTAGSFFMVSCRRRSFRLSMGSAVRLCVDGSAAVDMGDGFLGRLRAAQRPDSRCRVPGESFLDADAGHVIRSRSDTR